MAARNSSTRSLRERRENEKIEPVWLLSGLARHHLVTDMAAQGGLEY